MKQKILPALVIFLVVFSLWLTNHSQNTWLSGWDNLHVEFDLFINIKRAIFSVWEEYQGLGLLAGNGHAADLIRQIIFIPFLLFIPKESLRELYIYTCLFMGALGTYFLCLEILSQSFWDETILRTKRIASIFGSLYYLCSLGTVQTFYVSFEPFVTHYLVLPWLFLTALNFLEKPHRKNLFFLILVNILAVPQGQVPTVFLVYLICLLILLGFYTFKKKTHKKTFIIAWVTFVTNAFWFLPFAYFTLTSTVIPRLAKINEMATEIVFMQNKAFGSIFDAVLLRGFWLNNVDLMSTGRFEYMMNDLRLYLNQIHIYAIGYVLFFIVGIGIFYSLKKKIHMALPFVVICFFSIVMLTTTTPPFSFLNTFIRTYIPLFNQVFRFPFTKFSVSAALTYSIFFSIGTTVLLRYLPFKKIFTVVCLVVLLAVYTLPIFYGNFLYKRDHVAIPKEYFDLFSFFKTQDQNTRIANLPQYTFWGWNFYKWGYGGSGFLWYGINQPILDRAFDVWSSNNENYYFELSNALYSRNKDLFEKTLEKYQINWIMLDENIIYPPSPHALFYNETEAFLADSKKIVLVKQFGKIKVYQAILKTPVQNFVFALSNIPTIGPAYRSGITDFGFSSFGQYITQKNDQVFYPFRSLFTGKTETDREFILKESKNTFTLVNPIPQNISEYFFEAPSPQPDFPKSDLIETRITRDSFEIDIPKINSLENALITPAKEADTRIGKNCNTDKAGIVKNDTVKIGNNQFLRLFSKNADNCSASFWLPTLSHNKGYVVAIDHRTIKGKPLLFWIENEVTNKPEIETYLPNSSDIKTSFFIQLPIQDNLYGYTFHFENISIGNEETTNDLGTIHVYDFPYEDIAQIKFLKQDKIPNAVSSKIESTHPNQSLYIVDTKNIKNTFHTQTITLSQGYDEGWKAYQIEKGLKIQNYINAFFPFLMGTELKEHVLVNNWENGWILPNTQAEKQSHNEVVIIYLPQYLEYFGFLLPFSLFFFFLKKSKTQQQS